ncbi:2'-aminobiphenyl-2,3-diol 1,2-dioxygenase, large subunit [Paraburkholderia lycopersici]|uniref:2'-aminobiphenyl-2,3-diol 1,2-dioxygenase, large subunit n=2 Tax=Paraburkholderia lycopersici TaxID=416944 RepID=A0A1G6LWX3_9BURK|nr:2'-aminobiphenyl-2,3-diol 1,2-dioxygenase, large subunit [Paraburkholderia lycopersici]
MAEIGREIANSNPTIVIVVSSDHLNNFTLDAQTSLAIGIADEYVPLGDMGVPRQSFHGDRMFAMAFANYCSETGFDLTPVEGIKPDHGIAFPNALCNREGRAALVPLYLNTVMNPPPSCARSFALGKALREFVETQRPHDERIAVVGSGGLSHWICLPRSGDVNEEWDRYVMDCLASGRGEELASLARQDILHDGGNGGLEIASWAFVAGATSGATGRSVYYEPLKAWWTGMGGVLMNLDA